jgi:hypothetical protein
MRQNFQHRLDRLEAQAGLSHPRPTWWVVLDTIGASQEEVEALRAEAERLAMPPGAARIRIIEVRCPGAPGGTSDRERLAIWGHHPDLLEG